MQLRSFVAALLAGAVVSVPGAAHAQTFRVQKFEIGGDGGTDYLTAEPGTGLEGFLHRQRNQLVRLDRNAFGAQCAVQDRPQRAGVDVRVPSGDSFWIWSRPRAGAAQESTLFSTFQPRTVTRDVGGGVTLEHNSMSVMAAVFTKRMPSSSSTMV